MCVILFLLCQLNKSLDFQVVTIHIKGVNMSIRTPRPYTVIFHTNTNFEPIHLCIGKRLYRIEDEGSLHYLLSEENEKGQLQIENGENIPLTRVHKK